MKIPRDLDGEALTKQLAELGFTMVRQVGSHMQLRHDSSGELVTVPAHRPLKVGTLSGILRDVAEIRGTTREKLLRDLGW